MRVAGIDSPGRTALNQTSKGYFNEPEARYRTDRANFWSLP